MDFADVRTDHVRRAAPALMGSGFGEGENRAQEAAQEADLEPAARQRLDQRAPRGVLINITGGMDLAIDEVTTISSIIQEEAGDEAEIIFGAVHDPDLEGKIRVTVIATGFDSENDDKVISGNFGRARPRTPVPVEPVHPAQPMMDPADQPVLEPPPHVATAELPEVRVAVGGGASEPVLPLSRFPEKTVSREQIEGLDIPTFIRRQMD